MIILYEIGALPMIHSENERGEAMLISSYVVLGSAPDLQSAQIALSVA